jgi:hypothetical protein
MAVSVKKLEIDVFILSALGARDEVIYFQEISFPALSRCSSTGMSNKRQ